MNKPNKTIIIARAIIRIGDAARNANDYSLLGALREMVEQLRSMALKTLTSTWICCWNMSRRQMVATIAERATVSQVLTN